MEKVAEVVSRSPVVIFSKTNCLMSYTIKTLFTDQIGVYPTIYELDEMPNGNQDIEKALSGLGCKPTVPAVFVGGEFIGGTNQVMSLHLNRSLVPLLKRAGALWV